MNANRKNNAFSTIDLIMVIAAALAIALVVVPALSPRPRAKRINCTNNLKQVGLAFRLWAGDNNDRFPMHVSTTNGGVTELAEGGSAYAVFLVMSNELSTPKILVCPSESNPKRVAAWTFDSTISPTAEKWMTPFMPTNNLSYFVGLDADGAKPQTILSGEDHIQIAGTPPNPGLFLLQSNAPVAWQYERHGSQGNLAFTDGSVHGSGPRRLRAALINTGIATNRLAMP